MYEKIAWDNFYKTGDVESFLEYKKIKEINCENMKGEEISESRKGDWDSYKGDSVQG